MLDSLLHIEDLRIAFDSIRGREQVVHGLNLGMDREKIGIVGESGSGKSLTARAVLGLVRPPGIVYAQKMTFDGVDLLSLSQRQMKAIRGNRISMVIQDPKFSLNPIMSVGYQISEAYRIHKSVSAKQARQKTLEMLEIVRIRTPERVYKLYPHEVSGGMGQRIMIAMMLIPDPDLLIADEPTSALDVTVQIQVLKIIDDMVTERGMGLIFISHDLNLVASFCDRVFVMYAGRVVEECRAVDLSQAHHPYTRGLLDCLPSIEGTGGDLAVLKRDPAWLKPPEGT